MMNALEKLQQIGAAEIFKQTHISVAETNAILQKDFAYFSRAKALGFTKILEREYGVDLSLWLEEFEEFHKTSIKDEGIFISVKEESSSTSKILVAIVVALIAIFAYTYISRDSTPVESVVTEKSSIVEEAKELVVQNNLEINESKIEPDQPALEEEVVVKTTPTFYIEPSRDLWIGVYYSDTGQREGNTTKELIELDPNRNQIITLGHGSFKLVHNNNLIEPKGDNLYRFRLKDGVLSQMSTPVVAPKSDTNQSAD